MATKVTVTRTAKRKDGASKGTVSKRTTVKVGKGTVTVAKSRSVNRAGKENVRANKAG